MDEEIRTIYLAGGCFWGIEHLMKALPGVVDTACGYANGTGAADANYEKVCTGTTNFRETVRVRYDATKTSVDALLYALFQVIEPDAVNRQGADVGTQYQAGVFWGEDEAVQLEVERICAIERERVEASGRPFRVLVEPLTYFWDAEEYHQRYLVKTPGGYCHVLPADIRRLVAEPMPEGYYAS